jgi:hypothetical protein
MQSPALGTDVVGQPRPLCLGQVLRHRAAQFTVGVDQHVGQAAGAALLRPVLPGVELLARLVGATRHHDGPDVRRLEHAERRVLEVVGALDQLEPHPQVRLVAAEPRHRLGVRHPWDRRRDLVPDQPPQRGQYLPSDSAITSSWSAKLISMSSWVNSGCRSARKSSSRKQRAIWKYAPCRRPSAAA